jgi:hypothetical protein
MTAFPQRFLGLVTKRALAEMLAHTYADSKNIDPNDAYLEVEQGLSDLRLVEGLQNALWSALIEARPKLDPNELIDLAGKKVDKRKSFRALKPGRADQPALAALVIALGRNSSSSGEAVDLLDTAEGQKMLARGVRVAGELLAKAILK